MRIIKTQALKHVILHLKRHLRPLLVHGGTVTTQKHCEYYVELISQCPNPFVEFSLSLSPGYSFAFVRIYEGIVIKQALVYENTKKAHNCKEEILI